MPRKPRVERAGFYHIINRGVNKNSIYHDKDDFIKFLTFLQDASDEYAFEIYSYCLMNNHYHLLLKTTQENISQIMQKINSRYSIYFNKKYKRVGPLWQGRFKSWFIYDTNYLSTLVRYIEFNPIKAKITKKIGEYPYAMSGVVNGEFSMLNFELIKMVDFDKEFDDREQKRLDEFLNTKIDIKDEEILVKQRINLDKYFKKESREVAIYEAIKGGYKQSEIAKYLNLSHVAISKILKIFRQKVALFDKLKRKGIFWSYSQEMSYHEELLIEHTLKYADFDDIILLLKLFGKRRVKAVWEKTMMSDKRFIKLNLMIARVFFKMEVESEYFEKVKNARFEKLKLLAS